MKVGNTILIHTQLETHAKEVNASFIMEEYTVTKLFEDATPPQMEESIFGSFPIKIIEDFQGSSRIK